MKSMCANNLIQITWPTKSVMSTLGLSTAVQVTYRFSESLTFLTETYCITYHQSTQIICVVML